MRLLFSEYNSDYNKYQFPYQVYAIREEEDELSNIYASGFLPTRIDDRLFYLNRSLRIDLTLFEESSENRRISKKNDKVKLEIIPLNKFEYDYTIGKFAKDFYDQKFGKKTMSAQRIKWLFTSGAMSHVAVYKIDKEIVGYCLLMIDDIGSFLHYAYPFYNQDHNDIKLGIGMMLKSIQYAKENDFKYVYLGSVYSEPSLYKTQYLGLEYFTGLGWSSDIDQLKSQIREPLEGHLFEHIDDKSLFIDQLTQNEG